LQPALAGASAALGNLGTAIVGAFPNTLDATAQAQIQGVLTSAGQSVAQATITIRNPDLTGRVAGP
jgi:hypothetical protein